MLALNPFTTLIATAELAALVESGIEQSGVVIVDCRSSLTDAGFGARAYAEGHIPGAVFVSLDANLSRPAEPSEGRHPLPDPAKFMAWLGSAGISPRSQVVAYDDVGGAIAGRLWWMLSKWLGHSSVAVLDGGIRKWTAEDRAIQTTSPTPTPVTYSGTVDDSAWITTDELVTSLEAGTVTVLDARTEPRYLGDDEPIDPVAGHIPGARLMFLGGNLSGGCFADAEALRERFAPSVEQAGGADAIVHSCGSGVSALHNMIAMEKAGLHGSRLYVGSWSEWIRDPARKIGKGPE